jgi:paraquat-inducible protein B
MSEQPVIQKQRGISAVWILPILALCLCGWLLYSSYQNRGIEIVISFNDATGITPGKTRVMAKGIPIGLVKKLIPDLGNQQVKAIVRMEKPAVDYLVEDTLFWVVRPELSASSIQGLDTILSGSYIGIQVGSSENPRREFKGLSTSPPVSRDTPGLHIRLRAEKLGSIQTGTGVYYRNIEIGDVEKYELEGDKNILIDLFIKPEYSHLVRTQSRFCNVSGVQISGKLPSLKIQVESLASLLRGGILLHTPQQLKNSPAAQNGHIFQLYPDYESANYGLPMTLKLASGENIVEGATKVMYRGIEAGFVKEIQFNNDEQRSVTAHILLDPRAELILRENTVFWLVKPKIGPGGIQNLRLLISGPHITFQPGDGKFKNAFEILPEPPPQKPLRPGKSFLLTSEDPVTLSVDSPVYFRNIAVGEIIDVDLDQSGRTVKTTIFIYQRYLHLLSRNSVFWKQEGLELAADVSGIKLKTGPLSRLLYGGISFTTPDKLQRKKNFSPAEGEKFPLYSNLEEARKLVPELQQGGRRFQIMARDARSLSVGAPILHKNIQIGHIESFQLAKDRQRILIDCFVKDQYRDLVNGSARFYNISGIQVTGGLEGLTVRTGSLQSVFSGGIGCISIPGASRSAEPFNLYKNLEEAQHSNYLELTIHLENSLDLEKGSPVKFKNMTVGKVMELSMADNLKTIIARILVEPEYTPLFRSKTRFWVEEMKIDFSGVSNVRSLVFGPFLTFLPGEGSPRRTFMALNSPPYTEIANSTGLGLVLETRHLGSLDTGSPVYYRQVQIGHVTGAELDPSFRKVLVFITIDSRYMAIVRKNTKFWNVSGIKVEGGLFSGLTVSTESFQSILKGGIALATPENEINGGLVQPGDRFTLHDKPEKQWLDWNPDIVLMAEKKKKQAQGLPD